jgi:CBS domain containing-hemolysin-like protein
MEDSSMISIVLIAIMIIMSAYFSATETAFSSLNRIRIKTLAEGGSKRAALVLKLSQNYDNVLSTILVGNNIVNIASASIATVVFVRYFGDIGVTFSTIVTTVVVLIFAEISPKSIAKESPESFAMLSAPILHILMVILTPVNLFFTQWKKLLSRLFKTSGDRGITEEELLTIVEEAQLEGAIDQDDKEMINNVIEFNDSRAADIITPRVDLQAVSKDAGKDMITSVFLKSGYSRIPVYEGTIDNIIGVIHLRDFFDLVVQGSKKIDEILSKVIFVTTTTKISDLLKYLQKEKSHLAVVTDEYGGTVGIVTMEDILEELVGEIWDEHDEIVEDFTKQDDGGYRFLGSAALDLLLDEFHLSGDFNATTVSGWIMEQLDKIPQKGDHFDYEQLTITVTRTDHRRVLECHINQNLINSGAA